MTLADYVNTFGQDMLRRYGERVHKLAINAEFTCPNRDGSKGIGGCSFCNNASFSPHARLSEPIAQQIDSGRRVIAKRTRARKFIAYFQAYTNTYADISYLKAHYDEALAQDNVIGLAIGTRPDCVPPAVLDLLAHYQDQGHELWLELGLQSSFDATLDRVNRGHSFADYVSAMRAAHERKLRVCTHLIIGLPGEDAKHARTSLQRTLDCGTAGLKLHPLHVVKGTQLARSYARGDYQAVSQPEYIQTAADMIESTPPEVVFHRLTGTAAPPLLLAPDWCAHKWEVLNRLSDELASRGSYQGYAASKRRFQ